MNFNTLAFLVGFLPLVWVIFHLAPLKLRLPILTLSSFIFYGASGLVPLEFMILSLLWGFGSAFLMARFRNRLTLLLSIAFPLGVLYFFKYLGFTLDSVSASAETRSAFSLILSVTLPAGISFYTFQIVSYSVDAYDRSLPPERNLWKFATYISFFPQLIAGPILRYPQIREQLTRLQTEKRLQPNIAAGLKYLSVGLFAKTFGSDLLLSFQEQFNVQTSTSSADAAFSVLAYSFVIYYDFWSYSLMAIGLGKLFSIDLPRNFLEPYKSTSPREFWRRWHVTLSFWLRDYVYVRLGGNARYVRNIVIVFLACGLWHGAGWNFVVWGAYHAALVVLYHATRRWWDRLPNALAIGLTFGLVTLGWPLFYLDVAQYLQVLSVLGGFELSGTRIGIMPWAVLAAIAFFTFVFDEEKWLFGTPKLKILQLLDWPAVQAGLVTASVLFFSFSRTFIYFRF